MKQYVELVKHILATGTRKENRTGVDTISTFNHNFEHDLRDGFPLLTTKSVSWKNIVVEMLWFLSGQTDISILKRHGCKFWDAWADEQGKVPSAYGNFWRHFPVHGEPPLCAVCGRHGLPLNTTPDPEKVRKSICRDCGQEGPDPYPKQMLTSYNDQIAWVLAELKRNPMSRRMVVSAWAPSNAQTSKLPPCHCLFMLNVQNEFGPPGEDPKMSPEMRAQILDEVKGTSDEHALLARMAQMEKLPTKRLCLHLTQRSCDTALGVPYNIASYALLLSIFSHLSGIEPGIFAHTLVDAHIYTAKPDGSMAEYDHIPGLREQVSREPRPLPKLKISDEIKSLADIERLMGPEVTTEEVMRHFVLEGYDPHPAIAFRVAV